MIYRLGGSTPQIGKNNFIAENATLVGNVVLGENVTVMFGAVIRADLFQVTIGDDTNIQDNVIIHGDEVSSVKIGNRSTIGHNCVIHGCTIGENTVIGMGSTLLNGVVIPNNCLVAAGSVVTPKLKAEEGDLIGGVPARVIRKLSKENRAYLKHSYKVYVDEIKRYSTELEEVEI